MHTSTLLLPLISLISTASARALFTSPAYFLPSLTSSTTSNSTTTFTFTVYDADPVTNISTTCTASWPGTAYPSQWMACDNSAFDWKLSPFTAISNFQLEVKHSFEDPSLGPPPQNVATTFAKATFTKDNLTCTDSACSLKESDKTVKLPIWAASG